MKLIQIILVYCAIALASNLHEVVQVATKWEAMDLSRITKGSASLSWPQGVAGSKIHVRFNAGWRPYLSIPLDGVNLNHCVGIAIPVTNTGTTELILRGSLENKSVVGGTVILKPGETDTLGILFRRSPLTVPIHASTQLPGIAGLPGGYNSLWDVVDPSQLSLMTLYATQTTQDVNFELGDIYGWGHFSFPSEAWLSSDFFPWVDQYGQYKHDNWVTKTTSDQDLLIAKSEETIDLALHPSPSNWDEYRGWTEGPSFTVTGHFYTTKYQGKWWLVTPTGKLFWSFGADVFLGSSTQTTERTNWFETLPAIGSTEGQFYANSNGKQIYDFSQQNLLRKYSAQWKELYKQLVHDRFLSWGLNSYAGWSDASFNTATLKTPYFQVSYIYPNVVDVSDTAAFRAKMKSQLSSIAYLDADPWLVGVFVGNELNWGEIGSAVLANTAHNFYSILREEFKKALPHKLYLCDRQNTNIWEQKDTASNYCDVVSINRYAFAGLENLLTPNSVDKPVLISEFEFGSVDAGGIGAGLMGAASQKHRAEAMEAYVRDMLLDSSVVGAHWFVYKDQPITGRRNDAENYNIGFIDVADHPYADMVYSSRHIGRSMYDYRTDTLWDNSPLVMQSSSSVGESSSSQSTFLVAPAPQRINFGPMKRFDLKGRLTVP